VFRPLEDPRTAYIKRIVGLPGERVEIRDGDVWIDGQRAAKPAWLLRELAIPIHELARLPDDIARRRWTADQPAAVEVSGGVIRFRGATEVRYHHRPPTEGGAQAGDFDAPIDDHLPHNADRDEFVLTPVRDLTFAAEVEVPAAPDAKVLIGLRRGPGQEVLLQLEFGARTGALATAGDGLPQRLATAPMPRRVWNRARPRAAVWFAVWDGRVTAWLDGEPWIPETPLPAAWKATEPASGQPCRLAAEPGVALHNIRLGRDLHFARKGAGMIGAAAVDKPFQLGPDECFMLGDNSLNSRDSRQWEHHGVPARCLVGRPWLRHWPASAWRIPGTSLSLTLPDWARLGAIP
jgi:signal peptidase I